VRWRGNDDGRSRTTCRSEVEGRRNSYRPLITGVALTCRLLEGTNKRVSIRLGVRHAGASASRVVDSG
jgi:hypothetical protein